MSPSATRSWLMADGSKLLATPKTIPLLTSLRDCNPGAEEAANGEHSRIDAGADFHAHRIPFRHRLDGPAPGGATQRHGRHYSRHARDYRLAPRQAGPANRLAGGRALGGVAVGAACGAIGCALGAQAALGLGACGQVLQLAQGA